MFSPISLIWIFENYLVWLEISFQSTLRGSRLSLEVIPEVEGRSIGSIKVGFWLQNAHKDQFWPWKSVKIWLNKLNLDLWKYSLKSKIGFGSTILGRRYSLAVIPVIKESFKDFINVVTWLNIYSNKFILDIRKLSNGIGESPWKYSQRLKIIFGSHPRGWRGVNRLNKGRILVAKCSQGSILAMNICENLVK